MDNNKPTAQPKAVLRELKRNETIEPTDQFSDGTTVEFNESDGAINKRSGTKYITLINYHYFAPHWRLYRKDTSAPTNS